MLRIGNITLGEEPRAAIALQAPVDPEVLRRAAGARCVVELRLDQFTPHTPEHFVEVARAHAAFPILATIRWAAEGGGWTGSEDDRDSCYRAVLPHVGAVDMEIAAGGRAQALFEAARAIGRLSVGSFHDFKGTPSDSELEAIHARGRALGADIVKVAARCNSRDDLQRLAAFTLAHRDENVIVIGMGEWGMASRVFFPALGSLLTYTFLGEPAAPGQLNCADTLKYLDTFYPQED